MPSSRDSQQQAQPYMLRVSQLLAFAAALAPLVQQVQRCAMTRHLSSKYVQKHLSCSLHGLRSSERPLCRGHANHLQIIVFTTLQVKHENELTALERQLETVLDKTTDGRGNVKTSVILYFFLFHNNLYKRLFSR